MTDPPGGRHVFRLGTRSSTLARWQADWVAAALRKLGHDVELVEIKTRGDAEQSVPVGAIGTQGVFTKEIQRALLGGETDLAVHSLKDLPTAAVEGLVLAAVPQRASPADVLVTSAAASFDQLTPGARIGTGSPRRAAQLRHARPDIQTADVRGNVETRLAKLDAGEFDALVLAEAGLERLGLTDRISQVLPFEVMLPAVGQGALAIECRTGDERVLSAVGALDDPATRAAVTAERSLMAHLQGGCLAPVGALGRVEGDAFRLSSVVLSADGCRRLAHEATGSVEDAEGLGRDVAEMLLSQGAAALIAAARD